MPQRLSNTSRTKKGATVAIIGTGLIGASIGLAAREAGFDVVGWDMDPIALRQALRRRAIARAASGTDDAIAAASIVILAAPLDAILADLARVFAIVSPRTLIIDVAGVKAEMVARACALLSRRTDISFVAGHPMAGSERAGPAAADRELLLGRVFALHAPAQRCRAKALAAARRFVRALGAVPLAVVPLDHDRAVAALSALPQLSSIALALAASDSGAKNQPRLAGPGYRDATRLAESPFASWKPAIAANRKNAVLSIRALARRVHAIEMALVRSDWPALERLFSAAAAARRRVKPL
jgi:prephenate dehydrogenase